MTSKVITARSTIFSTGIGAYAQVFQRPGEPPMVDLNYFEGNRGLDEALALREVLDLAIERMKEWSAER